MHIAITNFKGGQGKTSLAYHFASQYGFGIVTNDPYTPLERWLDEERLLKILPDDPVPEVPADWDVVFDLGGYLDRRMATLLAGSDWIIVPFIHDPQAPRSQQGEWRKKKDHLTRQRERPDSS